MGETFQGGRDGAGFRIAVAVSRFNESVTRRLLQGALGALRRCRVADDAVDVAWAPGAFDLPVVAQALARSGRYLALSGLRRSCGMREAVGFRAAGR